jgi:cyclase
MDTDGTRTGYDVEMISLARKFAKVPLIASGGAGVLQDFDRAIAAGADALLAASVFHYGAFRIRAVKDYLRNRGHIIR